ncbi:TRAP transporter small permease [Martelella soudanensis]|uniref:TRAP transporter small permease n=1 Tax=unclassified Martelella TaxID=2629616 RepID=UPI0015DDF19C|nr:MULTISPECIES: TRAP transporter small permease [unclassified Martelella]
MFARIYKAIETVLAVLAGTGLLAMMILTFADVIGRYGFHHSIFGTAEYVEFLMVVTIFAGVAFVSAHNEHITVSIFESWYSLHFPNLQRWAVLMVTLLVYALMTFELYRHAGSLLKSGKMTAVLSQPQWLMPMAAAIFSTLGVALFAIAIIRSKGRLSPGAGDPGYEPGNVGIE